MRITPFQFKQHVKGTLAAVYLLTGNEPLQLQEAYTQLLARARENGFTARQRFDVTTGFDWSSLQCAFQNASLFSDKHLLDVTIANGKPGTVGSQILTDFAQNPPPDRLLLLRTGKLEAASLRSKWVKAIEKHGVLLQSWPIPLAKIPQWLTMRLKQAGLQTDKAGLQLLADRIEGNLLAGAQAIEKLQLLHNAGTITATDIANAISDSAQYDVFALVDACLQGNTARSLHILAGLKGEGSAPAIVLWALVREIRTLAMLAFQLKTASLATVLAQSNVWEKRKALTASALKRINLSQFHAALTQAKEIDLCIKGLRTGEPWQGLSRLCLELTSQNIPCLF